MNEPRVALIIINFNGKLHLNQCLESIFNQTYKNFSVIIVDNNSVDDSVRFIKENYPNIELIENKRNIGFGKAINQVLKQKLGGNDFKFFGVLNNDIKLDNRWLENLIEYSHKNPKAGILSGKILLYHWPKYINSTGVNINYSGYGWDRDFFELDKKCDRESGPVLAVSGCATLVRTEVFKQIGLYDHDYFMYYEDSDLCFRTWKYTEFTVDYVESAVIYHKFSASLGVFSVEKHFYIKRSRFIFILKNFPLSFVINIFPRITSYEFGDFMLPLIKRLDFANFFREFFIYLIFFIRFPFFVIKKLFARKKAKKYDWWKMLHPTYFKSATRNINPEFVDIIKPHFEKYGTISNRVVMGINDAGIVSGWSNIINSIPRGRYLFNKGDCRFVIDYVKNKNYYLQIHYRNYENQGKKLRISAGNFSTTVTLDYGWNTEFVELPNSLIKNGELNINLELVKESHAFEDLFVNEISVLVEDSNLLRLV